ncbi:MAG: (2Fe-2S)-binding protein [Oscillospiraceae bacterium]|nr:(2Fe-2S)-binding protein [Oscillospiraceae bacterium]
MQYLTEHPILPLEERPVVHITVDGCPIEARLGDTIAAALTTHGIRVFRHTAKRRQPRGIFCGIGQCTDCVMVVDGKPNVRTCVTRVREGMVIQTQEGNGGNCGTL